MEIESVILSLSDEDIMALETEAAALAAEEFRLYWSARSKSPKQFYIRMSDCVTYSGNSVVTDESTDAGLAKWISDKRDIVDDFLTQVQLNQEKRITIKKYIL